MKIRVAKKIVKNEENLNYNKGQVETAKKTVVRYSKNAPK
jgi:hypothetical protein